MTWNGERDRHALASKGIRTTVVRGRRKDNLSLQFANEHGDRGIHLGDKNQYQHSRFRCPECYRGMPFITEEDVKKRPAYSDYYIENMGNPRCKVHGAYVDPLDTNRIDDLEDVIEWAKMELVAYERYDDKVIDEEEAKKFGDKSVQESWYDYFTAKLKYLKGVE